MQETRAAFSNRGGRLTATEAAEYLGVTAGTLAVWRSVGRYEIPFIKVGRLVQYKKSDLDAWLEQKTRKNGATA